MTECWYDLETTGLKIENGAAACQIACVFVRNGKIIREICEDIDISSYKRNVAITQKALKINGRSVDSLYQGKTISEIVSMISKEAAKHGRCTLFGYNNSSFDKYFLEDLYKEANYRFEYFFNWKQIDVFELVKALQFHNVIPSSGNQKLLSIAELFEVAEENTHDALVDIRMTRAIHTKIMKGLSYDSNKTV